MCKNIYGSNYCNWEKKYGNNLQILHSGVLKYISMSSFYKVYVAIKYYDVDQWLRKCCREL